MSVGTATREQLEHLQLDGTMRWRPEERAWTADPDGVVRALTGDGFHEYKRELARNRETHAVTGGMWEGLDPVTGSVATVIWIAHDADHGAHVFIEMDGHPVEGSAWADVDDAVLTALAAGGGRLTLEQIAAHVGMSEDAVRSVVGMLAERGHVRIVAVELITAGHPTKVEPHEPRKSREEVA